MSLIVDSGRRPPSPSQAHGMSTSEASIRTCWPPRQELFHSAPPLGLGALWTNATHGAQQVLIAPALCAHSSLGERRKAGRRPLSTIKLMKTDSSGDGAQREEIKARYGGFSGCDDCKDG